MTKFLALLVGVLLGGCGGEPGIEGTWTETSPATFSPFCQAHFFSAPCSQSFAVQGDSGTYSWLSQSNSRRYFSLSVIRDGSDGIEVKSTSALIDESHNGFTTSGIGIPVAIDWKGNYSVTATELTVTEANGTVHKFSRN